MTTGKSIMSFAIDDVSEGCNYSDDITAIKKNQSPDSLNVEFFNGRIKKRHGETALNTPPTGQGGIDSFTKLMLHMDGTNASTTFTDSETTPKTVTANGAAQIATAQSKFGGASGLFSGTSAGIDAYTVLMLHMDGTNGSTTFTDSEITPKTVTPVANAQISTAQSKFGGASGLFDGTGDSLDLADSTDWQFGTGDFTIDLWSQFVAISASQTCIAFQGSSGSNLWEFGYSTTTLYFKGAGTTVSVAWSPTTSVWYHLAVIRTGTTLRFFVNGTQQGADQSFSSDLTFTGGLAIGS